MQRMMPSVLARYVLTAAVLAGGIALAPTHGLAQSYYRNGQTTTGDPYLNENDYDYNRQHMLPPNGQYNRNQGYSGYNNGYNYGNNGYDRDDDDYSRRYDQYRQRRNYGQGGYEDRGYGRYNYQRPNYNQQGYGRYQNDNDDD